MKSADFIYHKAASVEEVLRLLDDYSGDARILAGGQSLMPMMNMRLWRPPALVDINHVPNLDGVDVDGDDTVLGALLRYNTIETSPVIAHRLPLIAAMVRWVGDRQVRARGTIGGSLAQGDPTAEMPLGALVLGARVRVVSANGAREISMPDFYEGSYFPAIDACEMVTQITFPKHPDHFAFYEVCRRHNDFAVMSVAVCGNRSASGKWQDIRIGLGGVDETPVLAIKAAARLEGSDLTDGDIGEAAEIAGTEISPQTDIRASEQYRTHLVTVHLRRTLRDLRAAAASEVSS